MIIDQLTLCYCHLPDNFDIKLDHIRYVLMDMDSCVRSSVTYNLKRFIEIFTQSIQIETGAHEKAFSEHNTRNTFV